MNLAKQLHTLGSFAYKHPWRIVAGWISVLAILGFAASQFIQPPSSAITIPGTKAQESIDAIGKLFPEAGGATGRIVFHAKSGNINTYKNDIDTLVQKVGGINGVSQAISPFADPSFISKNNTIAYSQVQLTEQAGSVTESTLEKVQNTINGTRSNNLQIEVGGDLVSATPGEIIGVGEALGVAVALMVLIITLGSLIAGGMPILSAVLSVGVSMAGLFALSKVVDINSTTPVLAVMLGLAVGIDYALFIVNKYRTLLMQGIAGKDAVARAMGTAGNAVVFAAITVIIALAALSVVNIPFMTTMGLSGAASIAVAAIVTLTLIPALLGIAGDRIFSKKQRAKNPKQSSKKQSVNTQTVWYKWGAMIAGHPIPVLLLSVAIVAVIALPAKDMTLSLPTDQYAAKESSERKAYDLLSDGFGVGFNAPLTVVVQNLPKVTEKDKDTIRTPAVAALNKQINDEAAKQQALFQQQLQVATPEQQLMLQQAATKAQIQGEKQKVAALQAVEKNVIQYAKYVQLNKVAETVKTLDNVQKVQPALVTADGSSGILQVIPKTAPADQKTKDLIATLRDERKVQTLTENNSILVGVTGAAALQDDINAKLANALPVYLAVIVGLSLLLLLVAFRSILVPIKATLGYILSVLAMFGAIVVVFQWGWFGITDAVGPVISFMPIIAAGILFGLAMDYEFFLVSGMHESYSSTHDAKRAVIEGFGNGAKVVTAAAIIMISVFGAFITNHETVIQSIGFGLAVGILVDAFIVRMMLVPAVMTLLGDSAWWLPKWLKKHLPHISIEGESETKK